MRATVKLYNPYHDELGRFASKAGTAANKVKEHIKRNKGKYLVGGGTIAAAGIGAAVLNSMGKDYIDNIKVTKEMVEINTKFTNPWNRTKFELVKVGNPKVDDEFFSKLTDAYERVHDKVGNVKELEKVVVTDNYMDLMWAETGGLWWSDYTPLYEKHLREFVSDKYKGQPKIIRNIKVGALHILENKLKFGNASAFALAKSGKVWLKDNSDLGTMAHELIHNVSNHFYVPSLFRNKEATLKYEGLVDALTKKIVPEYAGAPPYKKYREKYLNQAELFKNANYDNTLAILRDVFQRGPESLYDIPLEYDEHKNLEYTDEQISDIDTLLLVLSGYYDLVKDDFERIVNEYISETVESTKLFNPYHDNLGRFTSGPSNSSALFGFGSSSVGISGKGISNKAKSIVDRVDSRLYAGTTDPKIVTDYGWDELKRKTGINNKNFLGAFMFDRNEIVISPSGLAEIRRQPKLLDRIMTHESTHARQRSGNSSNINFVNTKHAFFEEGLTDLIALSPANNSVRYNYSSSPYYKSMQAVARAARQSSNNDVSKAWQWITQSHYYNDKPNITSQRYNPLGDTLFRGTGTNQDIEWLFAGTPRKLEESDDEYIRKILQKSEAAKWKALGIEVKFDD